MSSQQRKQLAHEAEVKHLTNAKVSFISPLRRFLFCACAVLCFVY